MQNRWAALDHVRALAAFMVFCWHFIHGAEGFPIPFTGAPVFPFAAMLDEGHVGVSLFMCLSGYLFARLLEGRTIHIGRFIAARIVRLGPLLIAVFGLNLLVVMLSDGDFSAFFYRLLSGFVLPVWPNGAWSIAVELHFYILLPFILAARKKYSFALPLFIVCAILFRAAIFGVTGSVQDAAYWTIFGRIDQFLFGILAFDLRGWLRANHAVAAVAAISLGLGYYAFDIAGGFYELPSSDAALWIVLPTFEAIGCATLIGWYDNSFSPRGRVSDVLAAIGFYSYGIYLLHFFVVFRAAQYVHSHFGMSNFSTAVAFALPAFLLMVPIAWLAYRAIEKPLQRFKPDYIDRARGGEQAGVGVIKSEQAP
jgi:peptidoglycan/LPS O-acetylase OafA/YrhL